MENENKNKNKFRKKTAMVTGIPGGIGKATAERFLDAGYAVHALQCLFNVSLAVLTHHSFDLKFCFHISFPFPV